MPFGNKLPFLSKFQFVSVERVIIKITGNYDARIRVLAQYVARRLSAKWSDVEEFEKTTVRLLKSQEHEMTE